MTTKLWEKKIKPLTENNSLNKGYTASLQSEGREDFSLCN